MIGKVRLRHLVIGKVRLLDLTLDRKAPRFRLSRFDLSRLDLSRFGLARLDLSHEWPRCYIYPGSQVRRQVGCSRQVGWSVRGMVRWLVGWLVGWFVC